MSDEGGNVFTLWQVPQLNCGVITATAADEGLAIGGDGQGCYGGGMTGNGGYQLRLTPTAGGLCEGGTMRRNGGERGDWEQRRHCQDGQPP